MGKSMEEDDDDDGEKKRRIKLRCPTASATKTVELVASEDQRLDLGFISRAFGLEPNFLKLNGHFITRGLDLIACSVTWKSLLSFFSARGFSTGATDSDAIIVDGKLSKLCSCKRKQDTHNLEDEYLSACDPNENGGLANGDRVSKKRLKDFSEGLLHKIAQTGSNCLSLKRKLSLDTNSSKRTRTNEGNIGSQEQKMDLSRRDFNGQFSCSILSD